MSQPDQADAVIAQNPVPTSADQNFAVLVQPTRTAQQQV
jgi:hypothetical protein